MLSEPYNFTEEELDNNKNEIEDNIHEYEEGGLCMLNKKKVWSHISEQNMKMRILSDNYIDWYISRMGNNILSIVGGYEIEGLGINLFDDRIFKSISLICLLSSLK